MANRIRTDNLRGFNKGRSSKFREGSQVRQTPEEGRRTYRPKRCGNNNKDENNSPKTLNDKNQQASSQKFRQLSVLTLTNIRFFFIQMQKNVLSFALFLRVLHCIVYRTGFRNTNFSYCANCRIEMYQSNKLEPLVKR